MPVKLPQAITSGWPDAVPANPVSRQTPIAADNRRRGCFIMAVLRRPHSAGHSGARGTRPSCGRMARPLAAVEDLAQGDRGSACGGRTPGAARARTRQNGLILEDIVYPWLVSSWLP